jgi:hypothetical protein
MAKFLLAVSLIIELVCVALGVGHALQSEYAHASALFTFAVWLHVSREGN